MAGQGYKLFVNGNTLSASDLNTYVQQQTVMVFATTGARDTALSGVLAEGMQCYIVGTGGFYYNGSAWVANLTASSTSTLTNKTLTLPNIDNPIFGYTTTATAAGTTTLTSASTYQQYFTGTTTQTLVLPVASTLTLGTSYYVNNNSTGVVTVQSSGLNTIIALPANTTAIFTCILTSGTTAASWDADYTGATNITGTGSLVFGTSATLTTPTLASSTLTGTLTAGGSAGTNGYYLQTTGSAVQWAAVSAGAFTLITSTTLSGTSVTLSAIPQTYKQLYLSIVNPVSSGGHTLTLVTQRTDGSGSNNTYYVGQYSNAGGTQVGFAARGDISLTPTGSISSGSTVVSTFEVTFYNYTSYLSTYFATSGYLNTSNQRIIAMQSGMIDNNNVYNIVISGGSFTGGSVNLYGVN